VIFNFNISLFIPLISDCSSLQCFSDTLTALSKCKSKRKIEVLITSLYEHGSLHAQQLALSKGEGNRMVQPPGKKHKKGASTSGVGSSLGVGSNNCGSSGGGGVGRFKGLSSGSSMFKGIMISMQGSSGAGTKLADQSTSAAPLRVVKRRSKKLQFNSLPCLCTRTCVDTRSPETI
jgi:hypothetical protein